jgi:two-component system alkaline phosphatase synthesis response regulator PhoP
MSEEQKKRSILIIEDDPEIRKLYAHALTAAGLTVLLGEDGESGLELALEKLPDFLLLDVLLPKMSGIEVLKKVREHGDWGKHVPAILLTNVEPTTEQMNSDIVFTAPTYYLLKNFVVPEDVVAKVLERLGGL